MVAMKCLDEGVDVPATQYAYFLSSSTNSRQFIQRRGRILRKFKGKEKAVIFDFITVPPKDREISPVTRKILSREFKRFREFASYAVNKYRAKKEILDVAKRYHLLDEV
ncbi:MAG: helicase-related protein [Desulfurobacteriaceae bacterium]